MSEIEPWLRSMSVRGGKGVVDDVDARSLGRAADEIASLRLKEKWLGELLAVIHCDGGHYESEHGTENAVKEAMAVRNRLVVSNDALRERLRAAEELVALVRSRVSISQFGPVWGKAFMATEAHAALSAFDASEGKK